MAYGKRLYQRQARDLGVSLRLHSPQVPLALVTQWPDDSIAKLFDVIVPLSGRSRTDCRPKLDVDLYTPFRHTMYLDSDSLAVHDVEPLLTRFRSFEFVVFGRNVSPGRWYEDVTTLCKLAGATSIPQFSGGFMYFASTPRTAEIFAPARMLADNYAELGFDRFNHGVADEPLLSIALARHGIPATPTMHDAVVSVLGLTGTLHMSVVDRYARFRKHGQDMAPAVVHFASDFSSRWRPAGATYRRERRRLRGTAAGSGDNPTTSRQVNL